MKLDPLSPSAVAELAELRAVDPDELYRKTAGNPFFVVEALAAGVDEIPDTVRDAVLARVARLSAPARLLVEAVAVVPPQAELWLLDALAEDVDCLQECLASGVLAAGPAGVAFRHELARGRRGLRRAEPANRLPYGRARRAIRPAERRARPRAPRTSRGGDS